MTSPTLGAPGIARPDRIAIFATQPEERSIDVDRDGGNPFATALVQLLNSQQLDLVRLLRDVGPLTRFLSDGVQAPEVVGQPGKSHLLAGSEAASPRAALVIGYSDYSRTPAPSLTGVARDVRRVSEALGARGFEVHWLLDPAPKELDRQLREFARASSKADIAILYATGHGVQFGRRAYLLPGNQVRVETRISTAKTSIPITRLSATLRSRGLNLFLYGACRDDPFSEASSVPALPGLPLNR
ncbi:MAG: caspase family protein [Rubrivivax sp.]|nr:caspase family protein [Rubrivivax sp.]